MIKCGANKQKMKYYLTEKRGKPVCLKSLHNLQTSTITENMTDKDELEALVAEMESIPGASVKLSINEENELNEVYFQDERMKKMFNLFSEVVLFDATYKLNNRRMPLFVLLIVDGNGVSEIAVLFFVKSESRASMGPMLEY